MSYNGEIAIDLDSHIVERPTASDTIPAAQVPSHHLGFSRR